MSEISIIGGDDRSVELFNILQNFDVKLYGFDKLNLNNCKSLEEAMDSKYIFTGIPLTLDSFKLHAPHSNNEISVKQFTNLLTKENIVITALLPQFFYKDVFPFKINSYIDLLQIEDFIKFNAHVTAESCLHMCINCNKEILRDNRILITGYGRIGKILFKMLKNFDAKVDVLSNNLTDYKQVKATGSQIFDASSIKENLSNYSIIVNTIPFIYFTEELFPFFNKNAAYIEIASPPYGIELESARNYGINIILAQGLPGKYSPKSCAKFIYDYFLQNIKI